LHLDDPLLIDGLTKSLWALDEMFYQRPELAK